MDQHLHEVVALATGLGRCHCIVRVSPDLRSSSSSFPFSLMAQRDITCRLIGNNSAGEFYYRVRSVFILFADPSPFWNFMCGNLSFSCNVSYYSYLILRIFLRLRSIEVALSSPCILPLEHLPAKLTLLIHIPEEVEIHAVDGIPNTRERAHVASPMQMHQMGTLAPLHQELIKEKAAQPTWSSVRIILPVRVQN